MCARSARKFKLALAAAESLCTVEVCGEILLGCSSGLALFLRIGCLVARLFARVVLELVSKLLDAQVDQVEALEGANAVVGG